MISNHKISSKFTGLFKSNLSYVIQCLSYIYNVLYCKTFFSLNSKRIQDICKMSVIKTMDQH